SANAEAINHLTKGLELLKTLPDTLERIQQELALQLALAVPLIVTKSWAAPEVGAVYTRTQELCRQIGQTPRLLSDLAGLLVVYSVRAEHRIARELVEQILLLPQSMDRPMNRPVHYNLLGETLYYLGEFIPAREHLERAIALYDPRQPRHPQEWVDL